MWPASLSALLAAAGAVSDPAPRCAAIPDPDAPLETLALSELPAFLGRYRGCPALLELYASWCGTCVKIEPALEELIARRRPEGLAAVGISVDTDAAALLRWRAAHGRTYAPALLTGWSLADLRGHFAGMGVQFEEAVPFFVLLDSGGAAVKAYSEPPSLAELDAAIGALLGQ